MHHDPYAIPTVSWQVATEASTTLDVQG